MNIVWGVADLLRKAPPPPAPGGGAGGLDDAPTPRVVFSDSPEEGVLSVLWKKYENAFDKVEKEKSLQIFILQFVETFRDWGPHTIEQLVGQELGSDATIAGCSCGHPSEVILILIQEISLITSTIVENTTALSDGTYELIPDSEGGDLEAQANTTILTEAPDQSLEEPRAEIVSDYREAASFTIKPSVMYGSGGICRSASLMGSRKSLPPKHTVLGNQVPLGEICLFAHHCEAAEGMEKQKKEDWTICHVCSFEGMHDRPVMIKDIKDHLKTFHSHHGIPYECEVCSTVARTCADIRRHYYFAHCLPKGWWEEYIGQF